MRYFWKWVLFTALSFVGIFFAYDSNIHTMMWYFDPTRISLFLAALYPIVSGWIGFVTYRETTKTSFQYFGDTVELHNIADGAQILGMIGTVIGFYMSLAAFDGLDFSNISEVNLAMPQIALGIKAALITTITGLVFSLGIKTQLANLEKAREDG